jgi:site-specific recombinase XerD
VRAYAHALRLYLTFLADARARSVTLLRLGDLDVDGVVAFLTHLDRQRGNSASTHNCRLAALRGFFEYAQQRDPANADQYRRVLALRSKRARLRPAVYLEPEQMKAVLAQPDRRTVMGVRDHALLLFLYNTGARVAEALALRLEDIQAARPAAVRLHGKGNRERLCPIWRETLAAIRKLMDANPPGEVGALFRNARGERLTRDGAAYILGKYVRQAAAQQPALRRLRVTPHVLRHSCAVALLQAGVDLTVIRDYLGHASVATTSRYVSTNLETRRSVLEAFWKRAGLGSSRSKPWKPTPDILRFLGSL